MLAGSETFVPHTIDRGMLQFADIKIGNGCSAGLGCSMQTHSMLHDHSSLGPLSVVLKGESVPAGMPNG